MKYLLDTNSCIRYINGRAPQLRIKMQTVPVADIAVCSIVKAEMFYGAAKSNFPEKSLAKQQAFLRLFVSLPFDDAAAAVYVPMRAQLEKSGITIGSLDMLIAAIALANDLVVVTHNTAEYSRIKELTIEDWENE
jgi:tRNA(fMet)-specific endonuclease VapC